MRQKPLVRNGRFARSVTERGQREMIRRFKTNTLTRLAWLGTATLACLVGCSDGQGETSSGHGSHDDVVQETAASRGSSQPVPEEYKAGEERFNGLCARCHGLAGRGTNAGPPLVHQIYEPSHHADVAFTRAALQGVRAHHWKFGNMPKISEATSDDVTKIIGYVRWLQRQAGIC